MPEYLSPGVYVEEIDTGAKPIEGVSTSTAGFVGVTQRGPVDGLPVLVTSFTDFRRRFGGYLDEKWGDSRFLAYAVQGFFDNEGQRAYIKRVPGQGAIRSSLSVLDGIVTRLKSNMQSNALEANLVSLRGITTGTNVTFSETVNGTVFTDTRAVVTYDSETGRITWAAPLRAYSKDNTSVTIRLPANPTLTIEARDHGVWGNDIRVAFEYTTPSRSALVSRLAIPLSATMSPPLTLVTGPNIGIDDATLGAGQGALLSVGDSVEFEVGGTRARREITGIAGDVISWTGVMTTDFSVAGSTVIAIIAARPLTFAAGLAPHPTLSPTSATLGAGEGVLLRAGDTLEFSAGANNERRAVTPAAGDVINWTGNVENDYRVAGSAVAIKTAVRAGDRWILLPSLTDLAAGDSVSLTGGGQTENVQIDPAWNGTDNPVPLAAPVANSYLEGAVLGLASLAVRTGANSARVASAKNFYEGALVELDNGTDREYFTVTGIAGNDLTLSGPTLNDYQVGNLVRIAEFKLLARYQNPAEAIDELETFEGLSMNPNVPSKYVVTAVNAKSRLIRVVDVLNPAVPFDSPSTANGSWQALGSGDDGTPPPDDDFVGLDLGPGLRTGIESLTDIDQVSIVAVPGKTAQVIQDALIRHCENLMDRFAVLDAPAGSNIQQVQDFRSQYDTKYAALYYPWITVRDPLAKDRRNIPPSGHMIGIYARTDVERGVHKAPANEVIRGILDLEMIVNKREQDILNPSPVNINVLRDFRKSGRGMRVWGARCITSDTSWKYINVRRLFIFLEESLDEGTQWVVFEPNDEPLWARVRQSVSNFLTRVWRDGALMGATPEEAFFVKCDRTTMTQDDIDNGRLIMIIGVAPVKPAEFVIIRIGQYAGGSEVAEL